MTTDLTFTDYRFYILNEFDRPSARHIAEKRADGKFYYVHPTLCDIKDYHGMTPANPTPLADFGIEWTTKDGLLVGERVYESTATYADGRIRPWQDDPTFDFKLP